MKKTTVVYKYDDDDSDYPLFTVLIILFIVAAVLWGFLGPVTFWERAATTAIIAPIIIWMVHSKLHKTVTFEEFKED